MHIRRSAANTSPTTKHVPYAPPHGETGSANETDNALLAVVRAMARAEAKRLFEQASEQGALSMATAILLFALALLALGGLIALRSWVSLGGVAP